MEVIQTATCQRPAGIPRVRPVVAAVRVPDGGAARCTAGDDGRDGSSATVRSSSAARAGRLHRVERHGTAMTSGTTARRGERTSGSVSRDLNEPWIVAVTQRITGTARYLPGKRPPAANLKLATNSDRLTTALASALVKQERWGVRAGPPLPPNNGGWDSMTSHIGGLAGHQPAEALAACLGAVEPGDHCHPP